MTSIRLDDLAEGRSQDSTWSNPAKLSRKVREPAHHSHRALKAGPPPDAPAQARPEDLAEDLRDLRAQLQQKIHERRLQPLIPWVDGLRRQLEHRLATYAKREHDEIGASLTWGAEGNRRRDQPW
jgi:hypothetical protein